MSNRRCLLPLKEIPLDTPPDPHRYPSGILKNGDSNTSHNRASLLVSTIMVIANVSIICVYSLIFGWGWTRLLFGDYQKPEHWEWAGGVVGVFATLMRAFVIMVVFIPYLIMFGVGFGGALRAFLRGRSRIVSGILILVHLFLLMIAALAVANAQL